MATIPPFVIEYFLLGRTRRDAVERYTQDGGIVSDVWLAFAADTTLPRRVLVAPSPGITGVALGYALHRAISGYRAEWPSVGPQGKESPTASPLENFVAVTIYFHELIRIVLPMTSWWHRKNLSVLPRKAAISGPMLDEMLERAILGKLGHEGNEYEVRKNLQEALIPDRRVIEAAPLAALIGVFFTAEDNPSFLSELHGLDPRRPRDEQTIVEWINRHAETIARAARKELSRQIASSLTPLQDDLRLQRQHQQTLPEPEGPPELIQRVFLDRRASLATADLEAIRTTKSDAAERVFDLSCRGITWAIIDSGIASKHPAFFDHDAKDRDGRPIHPPPSRVRATFDFTRIDRIRNFDLIDDPDGSPERDARILQIVGLLETVPGRTPDPVFRQMAIVNLTAIARQLDKRLLPDWNLIEPLIQLPGDDGAHLVSDHGTHVAGILGADWRDHNPGADGRRAQILRGVCRDINLYDLRVIHPDSRLCTEFALLAALEFVQFLNARSAGTDTVVHGVNISLSIPHDVRNYGCGATPVCVACDRLVNAGVVVVAAAGNRGWNEQELGFGNFVFCSITDPGNAREVITVGSTHRFKPHIFGVSYFSSRGPTGDGRVKPDLVAPGEQIRGPIRGDADDELDGTSMAAPFVGGVAAMLLSRHRELIGDPERVKQILCSSATDLGREKYFQGHGLVDALRALQSV